MGPQDLLAVLVVVVIGVVLGILIWQRVAEWLLDRKLRRARKKKEEGKIEN